ncbi:MAG: PH domain-containing protein [Oscillospiraceae bacterium]|nr:PH domain-containing protein [Oscillospiraceae bacterium]
MAANNGYFAPEHVPPPQTKLIWYDRKRNNFGLPWSFTTYHLYENRLVIEMGFWTHHRDDVRLYRVMDATLYRSFWDRLFGIGTIAVKSSDKEMGDFEIKNVRHSKDVVEALLELVEVERMRTRVFAREIMGNEPDYDGYLDYLDR